MRPRALLLLLALTAGDYLLWRWSIADNHTVLSLLAGLTLVPLVAVSAARLALAAGGLLGRAALPRVRDRSAHRAEHTHAAAQAPRVAAPAHTGDGNTRPGRLAA